MAYPSTLTILDRIITWLTDVRSDFLVTQQIRHFAENIRCIDGKAGYLEVSYRADPQSDRIWLKGWYIAFVEMDSRYLSIPGALPVVQVWHPSSLGGTLELFQREISGRVDYHHH